MPQQDVRRGRSSSSISQRRRSTQLKAGSITFPNRFDINNASNGGGATVATIVLDANGPIAAYSGSGTAPYVPNPGYLNAVVGTLPAGDYSYRLCADNNASWVGAVAEGNEGNNCNIWINFTVGSGGTPPWTTYCTGGNDPNGNYWQWWQYDSSTPINYRFLRTGDGTCTSGGSGSAAISCSRSPSDSSMSAPATVTYTAVPTGGATSPYVFTDALGAVLQSGSGLTLTKTYSTAGSYAVSVAAANVSTPVACGVALTVTNGSSCGTLTNSIAADPTRFSIGGGTTHVSWSATEVNTSCIITQNGTTVHTVNAVSCSIGSDTALSPDPTITDQTKFCIICDADQAAKKCVTVNVGSEFNPY
jgi:hypothetical protein